GCALGHVAAPCPGALARTATREGETMRVWEIAGSFGLASLRLVERPEPRCGPGHIKLRMRKASLNYRDLMMIRGEYNPRQPLPLVPLSDGVGEVVEVGEGVTRFAVGDRVCPIFAPEWQRGDMRGPVLRSTL